MTRSPSKFAATVSLASVRPLAAISSTERRIRVASGCAASQVSTACWPDWPVASISAASLLSAAGDLINGAIDGQTFEIIICRHVACGGDDAVEAEIGLGGEEGRGGVADGAGGSLGDRHDIRRRDQGVEIGEFAGEVGGDAGIDQVLPALDARGLQVLRQGIVESGGDLRGYPGRSGRSQRPGRP